MFVENCVNVPPILDFEASSLSARDSYPISAGLVVGGRSYYWEIAPKPNWTDWSALSAQVHGISRSHLQEHGLPSDEVCLQIQAALNGYAIVYSDNPEWERRWAGALGLQDIRFSSVFSLIPPYKEGEFPEVVGRMRRRYQLEHHNAEHDAIALALAVSHCQEW